MKANFTSVSYNDFVNKANSVDAAIRRQLDRAGLYRGRTFRLHGGDEIVFPKAEDAILTWMTNEKSLTPKVNVTLNGNAIELPLYAVRRTCHRPVDVEGYESFIKDNSLYERLTRSGENDISVLPELFSKTFSVKETVFEEQRKDSNGEDYTFEYQIWTLEEKTV